MSFHQRHQIRHAVRDLLDGATAAGTRVYASRAVPFRRNQLPTLVVYTLEESVSAESVSTAPRELTREVPLVIEGWVAPSGAVDDAMDALALQIETAMHADPYLTATAAESILESTTMELVTQGEVEMGLVILTYAVRYYTHAPEAPASLDDFDTVGATYQVDDAAEADAVSDLFTVAEE